MHIKQVIIEGFKSYKDQTRTEPFSNKINTIVGANGAGKSNFFQAIRFVLDAENRTLRQEERLKLLHEGAGHAVLSAYVEIVLDNSDGRIQFEKDEIRLRRTVGLKKDIYQLQKKNCTKTEVSDMLESAGFSKANPYYVVQQGKITALSTMEDGERLSLLKEIGGSRVYEDRRTESLKILQDAEGRKKQIAELVADMEGKLKQLDAEKEELAKYQAVDKDRRSLEYAIHNQQISETRAKLEQIEEERAQEAERASKALEAQETAQASLKRLAKELKVFQSRQAAANETMSRIVDEKRENLAAVHALEYQIQELEESAQDNHGLHKKCKEELASLEKEIAKAEKARKAAEKVLADCRAVSTSAQNEVDAVTRRIQALVEKQGESHNFATAKERDNWIRKSLKEWAESKERQERQIKELKSDAKRLEAAIPRAQEEVQRYESEVKSEHQKCLRLEMDATELLEKRNEAQNILRDGFEAKNDLVIKQKALKETVSKLEKRVRPFGHAHAMALARVREISTQQNIPIHGTILEIATCIPQLFTAMQVAAGGAMFHVVVDNDNQSKELLSKLAEDRRAGRITVLPLNKLRVEHVDYPQQFRDDAKPLASYIDCAPALKPAMQHVFGKWMVCKDGDVASKVIASSNSVNCVTISGDKHEKKGKICGGYIDDSKNIWLCHTELVKAREELDKINAELQELEDKAAGYEQEKTSILQAINESKTDRDLAKQNIARLKKDVEQEKNQLRQLESQYQDKLAMIESKQSAIAKMDADMHEQKQQLGRKELGKLSAQEQQEKIQLQVQLAELEGERSKAVAALEEASTEFQLKEDKLTIDLRQQESHLKQQLASFSTDASRVSVEVQKKELVSLRKVEQSLAEQEAKAQTEVDTVAAGMQACNAEAEACREALKSGLSNADGETTNQLIQKRGALLQKKSELEKKIRDLGSLPSEAFQKFQDKRPEQLQKLLNKAQNALKKFGMVNKKALDQYVNFTEQREELVRRHDETVRGKQKIQQLIQTLDLRKDEAIERTFKGVAKNFREVFAELAPGGRGELVMQKAAPPETPPEPTEDDSQPPVMHERYSGVKVKVSFGGGETMSLKQLSGGQKTLVALALIFSIQRLDPAPFYLFDEIDAALDPSYRTTVAKMLAKQANDPNSPSQFIITTFHPQIISETDQVYGVSHSARISNIDIISKQDALDFLNTEENRQGRNSPDN